MVGGVTIVGGGGGGKGVGTLSQFLIFWGGGAGGCNKSKLEIFFSKNGI